MKKLILKVKKLDPRAEIPRYAYRHDSGLDLFALDDVWISPTSSAAIRTGISIELPNAFEAQVRPRSGLALGNQITVLNAPGTIDHGYSGEVLIILINHSKVDFHVQAKMKIAQLVIQPVYRVIVEEVESIKGGKRGGRGFGSTG